MKMLNKYLYVIVSILILSCRTDEGGINYPKKGEHFFFFSNELQSYAEIVLYNNNLVVYNNLGYIDIGEYLFMDSVIVRVDNNDTLLYLNQSGTWCVSIEDSISELKSINELLIPRYYRDSSGDFMEEYEWRKEIYELRVSADSVIDFD